MRRKKLLQERADLVQKLRAMSDKATSEERDLSDEEVAERSKFLARIDALKAEIDEEDRLLELERSLGVSAATRSAVNEPPEDQQRERQTRREESRTGEPQAFTSFGQMLQAVRRAADPAGGVDPRLIQAAATGMNESVGSDGGFLVQQQIVAGIRERSYQTGQILSRVNRQPVGEGFNGVKLYAVDETSRANGSRYGGIRAYWTAEGGEKLASKPAFREMDLKLKKIAALVYATDELIQDAVALEGFINRILPDELRYRVEDSIINGTGSGMPLGILNSGAVVTVTPTGGAGTFTYEDAVAMWSRMYAPSRSNAVWLISQAVEPALFTMTMTIGTGGVPVYMPAGGIANQPFSTLFGRPIIPVEYTANLGTLGDVILADFSQYTLIDKGDVQKASSMHVRFIYDETVFRFVYRVDGMPDWNSTLTPRAGLELSPFVVLGTRT